MVSSGNSPGPERNTEYVFKLFPEFYTMHCKKCPYFMKEKENKYQGGMVILGFCKLREKHVSDTSANQQFCKDRAVFQV
jgi:hypothetical protein